MVVEGCTDGERERDEMLKKTKKKDKDRSKWKRARKF